MKKILIIFGTRPEAIKMAPLVKKFNNFSNKFSTRVCVTAQHRKMLDQVLDFFSIVPDYDLDLMTPSQSLYSLTSLIILSLRNVLEEFKPDYVFVHGDTTTTMVASIASFYNQSKLCHVEAGLRTNNKNSPFPEEINRQITGRLADFHFAPTNQSKINLIKENIKNESILVTGNTVIDALLDSTKKIKNYSSANINLISSKINKDDKLILVTGHRRENHGVGFQNICSALKEIAITNKNLKIVYPVHLNPNVVNPVKKYLSGLPNIILIDPVPYPDFVWLMMNSFLIITDSGGVQEEAPSLGKPVLVMRENTERPEAVEEGTVILVGTNKDLIVSETLDLVNNEIRYKKMSELHNPYGDGKACDRIIDFISKIK
tara:strand:+ start:1005 stop:2126 length:1122 start_codon:yes stop_codon:yes gene_type:complete